MINENIYFRCDCGYYATSQEMLDNHQEFCHYGMVCAECKDTIMESHGGIIDTTGTSIICDDCHYEIHKVMEQNEQPLPTGVGY